MYDSSRPETKNLVILLWENVYMKKVSGLKAKAFWLKNQYFPYLLWPGGWRVTSEA